MDRVILFTTAPTPKVP